MSMKVITICGSFKFVNEMIRLAIHLELNGNIVLMPIFPIVDVNGYIGNSTRSEIEFANSIGKQIKYYSNCESL